MLLEKKQKTKHALITGGLDTGLHNHRRESGRAEAHTGCDKVAHTLSLSYTHTALVYHPHNSHLYNT